MIISEIQHLICNEVMATLMVTPNAALSMNSIRDRLPTQCKNGDVASSIQLLIENNFITINSSSAIKVGLNFGKYNQKKYNPMALPERFEVKKQPDTPPKPAAVEANTPKLPQVNGLSKKVATLNKLADLMHPSISEILMDIKQDLIGQTS